MRMLMSRSRRCFVSNRQASGGELGDVEQAAVRLRRLRQRIAEHGVAERAGGADGGGAGGDEFLGAGVADAIAGFFAEEGESAAGAAAEAALMRARGFHEFAGEGDDGAGLFVDVAIAAEIAGIVVDDGFDCGRLGSQGLKPLLDWQRLRHD